MPQPPTKLPITLAVITKNEELNIARCLQSAPWVDDIVVLDSGSQDRTVEFAKGLGARVYVEEWRGYRDQKARAVELAKNDWILSLDADEALSPELSEEIQRIWQNQNELAHGYESPRVSFHMGRWIWHGGWYPDRQIRFFDRRHCRWSEGEVHERVTGEKIGELKHPIRHWPFASLSDQVLTNNEYSSLAAKDLRSKGRSFSYGMLLIKPLSKFVETYLWKRGFLDGFPGFVIAVGAAYSMFLKWAKLKEFSLPKPNRRNPSQNETSR